MNPTGFLACLVFVSSAFYTADAGLCNLERMSDNEVVFSQTCSDDRECNAKITLKNEAGEAVYEATYCQDDTDHINCQNAVVSSALLF